MTGFATVEQLLGKPARTKTMTVQLDENTEVNLELTAIGSKTYDDMMAKHPPTKAQKVDQAPFNVDAFAPALISASAVNPKLSEEQAAELWTSPKWSRGELSDVFYACVELNNKGLDVPTTASA